MATAKTKITNVARKIKLARTKTKHSQATLAKVIGTSPQYVANLEQARSGASLPQLTKIAKKMKLKPNYFQTAWMKDQGAV